MSIALDRNGRGRQFVARTPEGAKRASRRRTVWYLRRLHLRLFGRTLVLTRREAIERAGAAVIVFVATWAGLATAGRIWP